MASAALSDPQMLPTVASFGAEIVLMHMQGSPRTMQVAPRYGNVVAEVYGFLRERAAAAWQAGLELPRIHVDPGIGFGKTLEDNLQLIRALPTLRSLGHSVVLGVSRKTFLGLLGGQEEPLRRGPSTWQIMQFYGVIFIILERKTWFRRRPGSLAYPFTLKSCTYSLFFIYWNDKAECRTWLIHHPAAKSYPST